MSSTQNLNSSNLYLGWTGWGTKLFTPAVDEDSCARETRMLIAHDDCEAVRSACSRCHRLGGCSRVHRVHSPLPAPGLHSARYGCTLCEHPNKSVSVLAKKRSGNLYLLAVCGTLVAGPPGTHADSAAHAVWMALAHDSC